MTSALSPELAIAYVHELSADVEAVVVLAGNGAVLAGETDLAAAAQAFTRALGDHTDAVVRTQAAVVFGARTPSHAMLAVASPLSLDGPTRLDMRAALDAMTPGTTPAPRPADASSPMLHEAANRAVLALSRH